MRELVIGTVLKPQGIRGEVKIKPYTDSAEAFREIGRIFLSGTEYKILSVRTGDGFVYLGLRGVADRNAAELLRGKDVVIPREEAPALPEGSYYIDDILGSALITEEGERLGTLKAVTQAATDIYTLETAEGREILFPAAKGVVLEVDLENKAITLSKKRFLEVAVL